jgi:uncharacterized membrane protein
MTLFLALKLLHVLSVIVAVGTNVGYAFWLRRAGRDRENLVFTIETLRRLDRRIANPAYGVALLTGIAMVATGAYTFQARWIEAAIGLYALVAVLGITLFAPAIRRQLAEAERDPGGAAYSAAATQTNRLGIATTGIVFVIVALMVIKPV